MVTTPSSNRVASDRSFPRSRWTGAPSFEEAAGITKFRVRQRATEARLESARSNLSRISDIVAEIDRQVNSLRRQAAKARRYGVLREELRELLRQVYVAEDQSSRLFLKKRNPSCTKSPNWNSESLTI